MVRYLINDIPADLYRAIKVLAALRGTSVRALILKLMADEVKANEDSIGRFEF